VSGSRDGTQRAADRRAAQAHLRLAARAARAGEDRKAAVLAMDGAALLLGVISDDMAISTAELQDDTEATWTDRAQATAHHIATRMKGNARERRAGRAARKGKPGAPSKLTDKQRLRLVTEVAVAGGRLPRARIEALAAEFGVSAKTVDRQIKASISLTERQMANLSKP
jgi:hypothetical protein